MGNFFQLLNLGNAGSMWELISVTEYKRTPKSQPFEGTLAGARPNPDEPDPIKRSGGHFLTNVGVEVGFG